MHIYPEDPLDREWRGNREDSAFSEDPRTVFPDNEPRIWLPVEDGVDWEVVRYATWDDWRRYSAFRAHGAGQLVEGTFDPEADGPVFHGRPVDHDQSGIIGSHPDGVLMAIIGPPQPITVE
jgi:hypothetical protein